MVRLNTLNLNLPLAPTRARPPATFAGDQLRRSVLACLLWREIYEDGIEIAGRIAELVPKVGREGGCPCR